VICSDDSDKPKVHLHQKDSANYKNVTLISIIAISGQVGVNKPSETQHKHIKGQPAGLFTDYDVE